MCSADGSQSDSVYQAQNWGHNSLFPHNTTIIPASQSQPYPEELEAWFETLHPLFRDQEGAAWF